MFQGKKPYKKWTHSFDAWAKNNLDELPGDDDMFNMYRRGLRHKHKLLAEMRMGSEPETPPSSSCRYWALQQAREEFKKEVAAASKAQTGQEKTKTKDNCVRECI